MTFGFQLFLLFSHVHYHLYFVGEHVFACLDFLAIVHFGLFCETSLNMNATHPVVYVPQMLSFALRLQGVFWGGSFLYLRAASLSWATSPTFLSGSCLCGAALQPTAPLKSPPSGPWVFQLIL